MSVRRGYLLNCKIKLILVSIQCVELFPSWNIPEENWRFFQVELIRFCIFSSAGGTSTGDRINYRPYSQAPAQLKQLVQGLLATQPIVNVPIPATQKFAPTPIQAQNNQYKPLIQYASGSQQPTYQNLPAPIYRGQQANVEQYTPQYSRVPAPLNYPKFPNVVADARKQRNSFPQSTISYPNNAASGWRGIQWIRNRMRILALGLRRCAAASRRSVYRDVLFWINGGGSEKGA